MKQLCDSVIKIRVLSSGHEIHLLGHSVKSPSCPRGCFHFLYCNTVCQHKDTCLRVTRSLNTHNGVPCLFTCTADSGTAVDNHRGAPWRPRPTGAQVLDCSFPPLKYVLAEVQHGRGAFRDAEVWPADVEVVAQLPSLSRLRGKSRRFTEGNEHVGKYPRQDIFLNYRQD